MRRGVDAARQTGDDCVAVAAKVRRQHARHLDAGQRCIARADDGDPRQSEDGGIAFDRQQRRRMVHVAQERRIVRFTDADKACASLSGCLQFGLGFGNRRDAGNTVGAARNHQFRQHFQRYLGRTEAVDQVAKRGGADILGADQPQPAEPLPVAEARPGGRLAHPLAPILPSVPASRREMFSRCLMKTMMLITTNRAAICGVLRT